MRRRPRAIGDSRSWAAPVVRPHDAHVPPSSQILSIAARAAALLAGVASAVEFVLEGLHLSKRLNKDSIGGKTTYRSRG